jgi:DNA processing protein
MKAGKALGFNALFLGDPKYPINLAESKDPPPVLWTLGDQTLLQQSMIGIVGARNASSLGTRFTRKLTKDLVDEGYCIVSGLARGIDAMAHEAALPHMSIGVQAGGLDVVYPKENAMLHARMATEGLRITEHPHGLIPQARHFPQRNRIVAGLVQGLIVIEGAARSGSLITAKYAADLGREVMAVPGNPMDGRAAGCNFLIRDGATLVRNAEDVIDCLGALHHKEPSQSTKEIGVHFDTTNAMERILTTLGTSGVAEDIVIRDTGLPASVVAEQITTLELNGQVERQAGGLLALIK